ncbi:MULTISPECIES: DMT family transporter [Bacillus]|uniref:Multidrug transporter n=2 Tax=Bacillus TaxID=1386 RepID=A0A0M4FSW0_9BACI|nr:MULTISPECIES: DMT family transporter [Bacillus]ALC82684.1 multidrug transporter [Bacillus gobiensis]MBP1081631.1 drug/metabolite transporter (DMT)-like permease [Bacillus capparidis]MED1096288.1 DMT family transporter [Bacillus capparidis]
MSYQARANMVLVVVNIFWGLSYVFMKMGLSSLQTFNIIALRCLIAFFIAGIILYKHLIQVNVRTMIDSAMLGILLFLVFTFVTYGVSMTSASNAGFLVSMTVIFVPVVHSVLIKRLPPWPIRIGVVVTLTGIGLLTLKHSFRINPGDLLCISAAFCYAIHILLTGKATRHANSVTLGIFQLGFAGILGLICSFLFETPSLPSTGQAWIAILGLGILCSAIGFVAQAVTQKYTTPSNTGLIFSTEPVFAALFAFLMLGDVFTLRDVVGSAIVILGILIAQIDKNLFSKIKRSYRNFYQHGYLKDQKK